MHQNQFGATTAEVERELAATLSVQALSLAIAALRPRIAEYFDLIGRPALGRAAVIRTNQVSCRGTAPPPSAAAPSRASWSS